MKEPIEFSAANQDMYQVVTQTNARPAPIDFLAFCGLDVEVGDIVKVEKWETPDGHKHWKLTCDRAPDGDSLG